MFPILCLLALSVIIPSACVLWFMNKAVRNERLAVRQQLLEVYQEEFQKFREMLEEQWETILTFDKIQGTVGERFFRIIHDDNVSCSSAILFDKKGDILYPKLILDSWPLMIDLPAQWQKAEELEYVRHDLQQAEDKYGQIAREAKNVNLAGRAWQGRIRCLIKMGKEKEAVDAFTLQGFIRNDYVGAMDAEGRLIQPNLMLLIKNHSAELLRDPQALTKEQQRYLKELPQKLCNVLNDYSYFPML